MKSLPENEMLNSLESRLRNYTEQPDDKLWNKIATNMVSTHEPAWAKWSTHSGVLVTAVALLLLLFPSTEQVKEMTASDNTYLKNQTPFLNDEKNYVLENGNNSAKNIWEFEKAIDKISEASLTEREQINKATNKINASVSTPSPTFTDSLTAKSNNTKNKSYQDATGSREPKSLMKVKVNQVSTVDTAQMVEAEKMKTEKLISNVSDEQNKKNHKKKGLRLYGSITPSLSYWRATPHGNDEIVISGLITQGIFAPNRFGISLETGVQGQLAKKVEYYAGLSIYHQRQTLSYESQSKERVSVETQNDTDYVVQPVTILKDVKYHMLNVGMQAGLFYTLKATKLNHKIGAGLIYQQGLLKASGDESYSNATSSYLSYQIFYRNEYPISKRAHVFFQPTLSRTLFNSENLNEPFSFKTSRVGVSLGVIYQLKSRR